MAYFQESDDGSDDTYHEPNEGQKPGVITDIDIQLAIFGISNEQDASKIEASCLKIPTKSDYNENLLVLGHTSDVEGTWYSSEGIKSPADTCDTRLSLVGSFNSWSTVKNTYNTARSEQKQEHSLDMRFTSVGNLAKHFLEGKYVPIRTGTVSPSQNLKTGAELKFVPRMKTRRNKARSRYYSGFDFVGCHDTVNDAVVTFLAWMYLLLDAATAQGKTKGLKSKPHQFPMNWRLIVVDCEGCWKQPGVKKWDQDPKYDRTHQFGIVELRSCDVQDVPYQHWHEHLKVHDVINVDKYARRASIFPKPGRPMFSSQRRRLRGSGLKPYIEGIFAPLPPPPSRARITTLPLRTTQRVVTKQTPEKKQSLQPDAKAGELLTASPQASSSKAPLTWAQRVGKASAP